MNLYHTARRVRVLRHIDAGNVITDIRTDRDRIVLDDPETGDQTAVTSVVREMQREGWCEEHDHSPFWRLTEAGRAVAYPPQRTPGYAAVMAWSQRMHGLAGDRHDWALECARLLDRDGPDAQLPRFPAKLADTRTRRDETIRRLYREAATT